MFGHVCTNGLNKVNLTLVFGIIQGKIIFFCKLFVVCVQIVESTHLVLKIISKHFVCPFL